MMRDNQTPAGILRDIWRSTTRDELPDCSPGTTCHNMKDITFDGYGDDPVAGWRTTLEREGKRTGVSLGQLLADGNATETQDS